MKRTGVATILVLVIAAACARHRTVATSNGETDTSRAGADSAGSSSDSGATPVTMSPVASRTLDVVVSGSGETDAVEDERVRAPFNGQLSELRVALGDHVTSGEIIGSIVAENSLAALNGARAMVSGARNAAERSDAQRALTVAEQNIVRAPLRVGHSGVVIARPASAGERVAEGDSIISVAATGSMVFFADIAQKDLAGVQPGQRVMVELTARKGWLPGRVHTILPADTGMTANMRVRVDLPGAPVTVGLFGTAHIVVLEHTNVPAVPRTALLRDDVSGVTRVALVTARDRARWVDVLPGISDSAWVEILTPRLRPGQLVITTGQVGLPDSTRVKAMAPDTLR